MKQDLIKLIATLSIAGMVAGCGSSGCSGEGCDDTTASSTSSSSSTSEPSVDVRQCSYNITNTAQTLTVGDDFNTSAISATATKGDGTAAATPTVTGLDDVNTSKAGSYSIVFASSDCDNTGTTTVTVNEPVTVDDGSNPLPF
jgi:hypothetical protein